MKTFPRLIQRLLSLTCMSPGADVGPVGFMRQRGLRGASQHVHGAGGWRLPAQDHDTHVGSRTQSETLICMSQYNVWR